MAAAGAGAGQGLVKFGVVSEVDRLAIECIVRSHRRNEHGRRRFLSISSLNTPTLASNYVCLRIYRLRSCRLRTRTLHRSERDYVKGKKARFGWLSGSIKQSDG